MVWTQIANLRGPRGYSVVSGLVDGSDHLKLTMNDAAGTVLDVGNVRGPQGLAGVNGVANDAATASYVAGPSATATAMDQRYDRFFSPETYGAVGDGTTDDTAAIAAAITAAAGRPIKFPKDKTFKVTGTLTFGGAVNLNGSTINSTNSLVIQSVIRNGKLTGPGSIRATSKAVVTVEDLEVVATATSSQGIYLDQCTDIVIRNCRVSGGSFRGILLARCDRFTVEKNYIKDVVDNAGYGILVTSAAGEVHGDGSISKNILYNCAYGIASNGGEANPSQPAFNGQYTLKAISITENKVYMLSYTQHSGIWATCSTGVSMLGNYVNGSVDTGIDMEYCTQSVAIGNTVVDVIGGGLAMLYGCTDVIFEGNVIEFNRATSGSASTSGPIWKNTSPTMLLLRDNPQRVTVKNNIFRVTNGTLGRMSLGTGSVDLVVKDNELFNTYMSGSNSTAGAVLRCHIDDNDITFTVNVNNPAIYHEGVLRFYCQRNTVILPAGEAMESTVRHYITVYDAGTNVSNWLFFIGNTVDDIATGNGIGISYVTTAANAAVRAFFIGNYVDKIGFASGITYTGITYEKNYKLAAVGLVGATQNAAATAVTMPAVA